jgi:hypothetical protein
VPFDSDPVSDCYQEMDRTADVQEFQMHSPTTGAPESFLSANFFDFKFRFISVVIVIDSSYISYF